MRCLLDRSDFVDDQNFPPIHKVVLGLSFQTLDDVVHNEGENINEIDVSGRTALSWAASRGDDNSVATLLSYGANPNITDANNETALILACDAARNICTRLLLEAGAYTDIQYPAGIVKSSPLVCAAIYPKSNALLLKILLDFGADVNSRNKEGRTALHYVAQSHSAAHAMVLFEHSAELNVRDNFDKTPLIMAVMNKNHAVLELLLDSWFHFTSCPRLDTPGLLHYVADFGDVETINIINSADHLRRHPDKGRALGQSELETLRQRPDTTEKLVLAFEDLLNTIKGHKMREAFASLKGLSTQQPSLVHPWLKEMTGSDKDSLIEEGLLGSPWADEVWHSAPETMADSLVSLSDRPN